MYKKYFKWVVFTLCLGIFIILAFSVFKNRDFKLDVFGYNYIINFGERFTNFFKLITELGSTKCLILISVILILVLKKKKLKVIVVLNLIFVTLLNQSFKIFFHRIRPSIHNIIYEKGFSFPSGHSMVSMAFYGLLIYLIWHYVKNKYIKYIMMVILSLIIVLIGISRIYLGVHFTSDVVAGFSFSIAYLILGIALINKYLD